MLRPGPLLLYAAALAGGLYLTYHPVFDSGFAVTQADTGDGMLNHYLLEHTWRALTDPAYPGTLTRPPFFFPEPRVWWYSETLIGAAPLYWGLRAVAPAELAFSWWKVVCSALNFVSFAAAARRLGASHPAAALGAFCFAFLAVMTDQEKHEQLLPRFWMPPAAYYAWAFASAPAARPLGRVFAFLTLQAVTCVYTGWFLGAGLAVFVPAAAALTPGGLRKLGVFARTGWRATAWAAGPWVVVLGAFFAPYLVVNRGHERDYGECLHHLPGPAGWLTAPDGAAWGDAARAVLPPVSVECQLFPGVGAAGFVLAAAWWAWRHRADRPAGWPLAAAALLTAAVWAVVCTRLWVVSPWAVVRFLPGGTAIRCVSRVVLVVDLFALLAATLALAPLLAPLRPGRRGLAVAAVAAAIAAEQAGYARAAFRSHEYYGLADRYAAELRGAEVGYVLNYPEGRHENSHVFAMWVGLRAGVPVVNGYSGRNPDGYPLTDPDDPDAALRAWLRGKYRGRVVVLERDDPPRRREVWVE